MVRRRRLSSALLFVLVGGWLAGLRAGDEENAAVHYRKAFALLPKLSKAEEAVLGEDTLIGPLDKTARRLLRRSAPALQEWQRGTALSHCDWGRDWKREELFPEMMPQVRLSKLACLRARSRYEEGRGREAAADLAGLIVMARHIGRNGPIMERLVQFSFEMQAIKVASAYLPRQNAETLRDLATRLNRLPSPGTLQEVVQAEKEFLLRWCRPQQEKLDRDQAYKELRESLTEEQTQARVRTAGGEVAALLSLTDEMAERYDEAGKILMLPADQFPEAWAAFRKKYEAAYPMAKGMLTTIEGVRNTSQRVEALFAMLRVAIAMTLDGPERRKVFPDPFGDGPFLYEAFDGGFELRSKAGGKLPAVLTVGVRKEK